MGDDVIHSGTLGAAFTARKLHFPPLAISIAGKSFEEFESAILATKMMLDQIIENYKDKPNDGVVINMNVPNLKFNQIEGFKLTKLGNRGVPLAPEFKGDENSISYKIGKSGPPAGNLEGTDFEAIKTNFISVTPLFWDMTSLSKFRGKLPGV